MSQAKLDEVQKRIDTLVEQYFQLQQQVQQQKSQSQTPTVSNEEIAALKQQLEEKDAKIAELQKSNAKLEYRVDFLVREVKSSKQ